LKRIATLWLFYFTLLVCNAQSPAQTDTVHISRIDEKTSLIPRSFLYIDSSASLTAGEVLEKPFRPLTSYQLTRRIRPNMVSYTFFIRLHLFNDLPTPITGFIYPGLHFKHFELYRFNGNAEQVTNNDSIEGYRKISLAAGEQASVLVELKPLKNDINSLNPYFIREDLISDHLVNTIDTKSTLQLYSLVIAGVIFMMMLFMVANYTLSRKIEFLHNAGYSFCMFLLVLFNVLLSRRTSGFAQLYYNYIDFFLLVTGTVFYITFARKFLDAETSYRKLDRFLKYCGRFVLLLLSIYTLLNFFTPSYLPQFYLENIMRLFILVIGLVFIYLALKQKSRLMNYIAAGNAMLVLFSVISFVLLSLKVKPSALYLSSLFYYNTGIVFELAFFMWGLTYKNRSELISNIKEQEALKMEAKKQHYETEIAVIKAQQEERNRISADMHDDLGAGMTTISLYSELAKTKLADNPIPEIEKISTSANELLNKMNAIIWSMNSSNDSLGNMIAYIRSYALEYFEDSGIECKINIVENLPNIEVIGEIRRNVFLVVKEALNNILKHSKATEVMITLVRVEDGLTLYIHDNGVGIDMDSLRQFGNGLKNMKKRMADINVEFTIQNRNGTLITMHRKVTTF
jgi:signal transduction histidine kinase